MAKHKGTRRSASAWKWTMRQLQRDTAKAVYLASMLRLGARRVA